MSVSSSSLLEVGAASSMSITCFGGAGVNGLSRVSKSASR